MRNSSKLLTAIVSLFSLVSVDCSGMQDKNYEDIGVRELLRTKILVRKQLEDPRANDHTLVVVDIYGMLDPFCTEDEPLRPLNSSTVDRVRDTQSKVRVLAVSNDLPNGSIEPNDDLMLSKLHVCGFNLENSWPGVAQRNLQPTVSFEKGVLFCGTSSISSAVKSFLEYLQNSYRYIGQFSNIVYIGADRKNVNKLSLFCKRNGIDFLNIRTRI